MRQLRQLHTFTVLISSSSASLVTQSIYTGTAPGCIYPREFQARSLSNRFFFFFPVSLLTPISHHFLAEGEKCMITWWWPPRTEYCGIKEMGVAKGTHVRLPEAVAVLAPKYKTSTALYTAVRVHCMVLISSNCLGTNVNICVWYKTIQFFFSWEV